MKSFVILNQDRDSQSFTLEIPMEEKASVAELLLICMHQLPPQYTLALVSRPCCINCLLWKDSHKL